MSIIRKKKIAVNSFNAKKILGEPESVRRLKLGTIGGIAEALHQAEAPTGEILTGLRGNFRAIIGEGESQYTLGSAIVWLPAGTDVEIQRALRADNPQPVKFLYNIWAERSGNPIGYEYAVEPVYEDVVVTQTDPLAELFARIAPPPAALPAPDAPPAALPEKSASAKNNS